MRIALFLPHLGVSGGLGVHCRGVVAALLRVAPQIQLTIFAPRNPLALFPLAGIEDDWKPLIADPRVTYAPFAWPPGSSLADPLDPILAPLLAEHPCDLLLCSYYTGMERPPCPQAVVFHDAGFLENPQVFGETATRRRAAVEKCRPAIDRLICVSADGSDRICRLLPFDPAGTAVVWHALSDRDELLKISNTASKFTGLLWPGGDTLADWGRYAFSPVGAATGFNRVRKNVPKGVAGFRRAALPDVKLVIASTGTLNERILAELLPAEELASGSIERGAWRSTDGAIIVLPNLDREPFLAAMSRAAVILYPTRYEGFGLPAVEAMTLGVPLIAGRSTSLPEVVGDAGLLVDPDDVDGFAHALRQILTEPIFAAVLVQKGKLRAREFTLERMGREMIAVFEEMKAQGRPSPGF